MWPLILLAALPWPVDAASTPLKARFAPPPNTARMKLAPDSFGAWLRELPVREGRSWVSLYNGAPKINQLAHVAVIDIDVGDKDLQQCADSVIRLHAEWQRQSGLPICYRFTSGDRIPWKRWKAGDRVAVRGRHVKWRKARAAADDSYRSFRRYLDTVFMYAGTLSLSRSLGRVDGAGVEPGDVFLKGGSPGHVVMVLDVALDAAGKRHMLLGQGFMPAQSFHVLRQPGHGSPWYPARSTGELETPEWTFRYQDLRRIDAPCP